MGDSGVETATSESATDEPDTSEPETIEVELLHGVPVTDSGGQVVLHPSREEYAGLVEALRAEGFWVCVDLCGVDYLTYEADRGLPVSVSPERFEVVVGLLSPSAHERLRIRVQVPGDEPSIASITPVHPGADAHEREVYDLFGIDFVGHPHLTRILLPDEWVGHPLRKDEPVGAIPVQFKATREERS